MVAKPLSPQTNHCPLGEKKRGHWIRSEPLSRGQRSRGKGGTLDGGELLPAPEKKISKSQRRVYGKWDVHATRPAAYASQWRNWGGLNGPRGKPLSDLQEGRSKTKKGGNRILGRMTTSNGTKGDYFRPANLPHKYKPISHPSPYSGGEKGNKHKKKKKAAIHERFPPSHLSGGASERA